VEVATTQRSYGQRLPAAKRREQILSAFRAEAVEAGSIAAVGVRAVVERAGCTAPVLYRLFGDRGGLVRAAVRSTHSSMLERMGELAADRGAPAEERIRSLAARSLGRARGPGEAFESLVNAECLRDPRVARIVREVFQRFETLLVRILRDGVDRGEFRTDLDPQYAAWRIIDLGLFRDQIWLMRLSRPEKIDYLRRALESLLEEIRS
jgi:AcrR family transcriptional regulator